MALTITFTPGKVWQTGESITADKLNATANPTINLEGSINSTSIADGSVTTPKLADGVLTADAPGRAKMEDTYLIASKLGPDVAGDGLTGGNGSAIAANPDGITITTVGGKLVVKSTGAGVVGALKNLIAFNNTGAPNNKADVTADEVLLKNASNSPFLALAVSLTVDLTASGANGLDTGSEASSTWYYLWVIGKTDGSGVAGLFSTSSTAPTLPATYTYKALVSVVRNNGSSNFTTFYQLDRDIYLNQTNIFTAKTAGADNTYESYSVGAGGADVDLRTVIPPIARKLRGTIGNNSSTANQSMAIAGDANGLGAQINCAQAVGSGNAIDGFAAANGFEIPLRTAQTVFWKTTGATNRNRMSVSSFSI